MENRGGGGKNPGERGKGSVGSLTYRGEEEEENRFSPFSFGGVVGGRGGGWGPDAIVFSYLSGRKREGGKKGKRTYFANIFSLGKKRRNSHVGGGGERRRRGGGRWGGVGAGGRVQLESDRGGRETTATNA